MLLTVLLLQLVTTTTPTELEARWQAGLADPACAAVVAGHANVALAGPATVTAPFAASLLRAGSVTQVQTLADKPDAELRASAKRIGASALVRFEAVDDGARMIVKRMAVDSDLQTAFILEAGAPCPAIAPMIAAPTSAPSAVAPAVAPAVVPVAAEAKPVGAAGPATEQEERCKRDRLNVRTRQSLQGGAYGNVVSIRSVEELVLSRGKYEQTLTPVDFLKQAGATKEAADVEQENANRIVTAIVGASVGAALTIAGVVALGAVFTVVDFDDPASTPLIVGGTLATVAGPVIMTVVPLVAFVAPTTLDPARVREVADEHNVKIGCPDP